MAISFNANFGYSLCVFFKMVILGICRLFFDFILLQLCHQMLWSLPLQARRSSTMWTMLGPTVLWTCCRLRWILLAPSSHSLLWCATSMQVGPRSWLSCISSGRGSKMDLSRSGKSGTCTRTLTRAMAQGLLLCTPDTLPYHSSGLKRQFRAWPLGLGSIRASGTLPLPHSMMWRVIAWTMRLMGLLVSRIS